MWRNLPANKRYDLKICGGKNKKSKYQVNLWFNFTVIKGVVACHERVIEALLWLICNCIIPINANDFYNSRRINQNVWIAQQVPSILLSWGPSHWCGKSVTADILYRQRWKDTGVTKRINEVFAPFASAVPRSHIRQTALQKSLNSWREQSHDCCY